MSDSMWLALIAAVTGVATSSGLWAYIQKRSSNRDTLTRLLMGLAYDKIITIGLAYIQRGWISKDEYEEYQKYLVEPYKELGGNGVAERFAADVGSLPIRVVPFSAIMIKENSNNADTQ